MKINKFLICILVIVTYNQNILSQEARPRFEPIEPAKKGVFERVKDLFSPSKKPLFEGPTPKVPEIPSKKPAGEVGPKPSEEGPLEDTIEVAGPSTTEPRLTPPPKLELPTGYVKPEENPTTLPPRNPTPLPEENRPPLPPRDLANPSEQKPPLPERPETTFEKAKPALEELIESPENEENVRKLGLAVGGIAEDIRVTTIALATEAENNKRLKATIDTLQSEFNTAVNNKKPELEITTLETNLSKAKANFETSEKSLTELKQKLKEKEALSQRTQEGYKDHLKMFLDEERSNLKKAMESILSKSAEPADKVKALTQAKKALESIKHFTTDPKEQQQQLERKRKEIVAEANNVLTTLNAESKKLTTQTKQAEKKEKTLRAEMAKRQKNLDAVIKKINEKYPYGLGDTISDSDTPEVKNLKMARNNALAKRNEAEKKHQDQVAVINRLYKQHLAVNENKDTIGKTFELKITKTYAPPYFSVEGFIKSDEASQELNILKKKLQ